MNSIITLGDHITTLKGYAFKSKWFVEDGKSIVKVSNFTEDSIDPSELVYISDEIANNYNKYALQAEDVVIQTVGSWPSNPASVVGKTIRVPRCVNGALLNQNAVKIESDDSLLKGYLYYVLRSEFFKDYIIGTAQGAASQASITLDAIKKYKFKCPSYKEQMKIYETLVFYDNLIENNNSRILILEEMAQSLYQEWFVKFRYPNRQNQKLINSLLGKTPDSWEIKEISDVAGVNPESITKKNSPEIIGYIDIKSVGTGTINEIKPLEFVSAPSRARRIVQDGDVIWATVRPNRKQYSYICRPEENTIVSTGFAVLRAERIPSSYLYLFITTEAFTAYLVNHSTGSAYPAVNAGIFSKACILIPPKELLSKFNDVIYPIMQQSFILKKKNEILKQQRDMLLPKLISGQIKV